MYKKILSNCEENVMAAVDKDCAVIHYNLNFIGVVCPGSFAGIVPLDAEQKKLYASLVQLKIINNDPDIDTEAFYERLPKKYSNYEQNIKSILAIIADNHAALDQAIMDESMGGNITEGICINGRINSEGKILGWISPGTNTEEAIDGVYEVSFIFKIKSLINFEIELTKIETPAELLSKKVVSLIIEQYNHFH
jgi:hypothetical protein